MSHQTAIELRCHLPLEAGLTPRYCVVCVASDCIVRRPGKRQSNVAKTNIDGVKATMIPSKRSFIGNSDAFQPAPCLVDRFWSRRTAIMLLRACLSNCERSAVLHAR
jgi:hypothetical protein